MLAQAIGGRGNPHGFHGAGGCRVSTGSHAQFMTAFYGAGGGVGGDSACWGFHPSTEARHIAGTI
jgi:hypothetical protein